MDDLLGWLGPAYPLVKALHIIFVIFWMAGLFILPRYLVHQAGEPPGNAEDAKWIERIARLRRMILTPSLVVTWVLGLALAFNVGFAGSGWLHAKLALVLLLTGYHGWMVSLSKRMARGERPMAERAFRMWNEVPALFVVGIVLLAVLRPF
ncbi:CopD family protein [Sandaracinobacteroides hominis]|uniref:CopD family protein n=1 Tax=Sandaracinobacteroides hominis TaxID=2780086 RepID=UPI0018F6CEBC|nr:CopD family protein [Sandaracinobacteroides hominis]